MLEVTYYKRPNGEQVKMNIRTVDEDVVTFFEEGDYQIDMEDLQTGDVVLYAYPRSGKE